MEIHVSHKCILGMVLTADSMQQPEPGSSMACKQIYLILLCIQETLFLQIVITKNRVFPFHIKIVTFSNQPLHEMCCRLLRKLSLLCNESNNGMCKSTCNGRLFNFFRKKLWANFVCYIKIIVVQGSRQSGCAWSTW